MKKQFTLLLAITFFSACSDLNNPGLQNTFNTKGNNTKANKEVKPMATSGPIKMDISEIPEPAKIINPINNLNEQTIESPKINFDILPPEKEKQHLVDGAITVIYKNIYKVRLDKKTGKDITSISTDLSEMKRLLERNGFLGGMDLGDDGVSDEIMDDMQRQFQEKRNTDIPHLRSIHYYKLSEGTDTKSLCKALMNLPYVRLAYPTSKVSTSMTSTRISKIYNNDTEDDPFGDTGFQSYHPPYFVSNSAPYTGEWYKTDYWHNQHQAYRAYNQFSSYYNNSYYLPKIAIVDSGFNANSVELNYDPGYSIKAGWFGFFTIKNGSGNCPNNNCIQETVVANKYSSHGEAVASVAAGKSNNGGGKGIIPNAKILPMKVVGEEASEIAKAIRIAAGDNSVDVINVSYSTPISGTDYTDPNFYEAPISLENDVNTAISYAVEGYPQPQNYRTSKPVTICAGNSRKPIQTYVVTDAVVVGGSMPSLFDEDNKFVAWKDSSNPQKFGYNNPSYGSNYFTFGGVGSNTLNLTASGFKVGFWHYNPHTNGSYYDISDGTSFSAPMVAATLGMMRKMNSSLSAAKLGNIVTYSSNLYRFAATTPSLYQPTSIGKGLENPNVNDGMVAGIRDLNVFNALTIALNLNYYSAITRTYNIDDYASSTNANYSNSYSPSYSTEEYGSDNLFGLSSLTLGSYLNFQEFNSSGGCSYGYQVYTNQHPSIATRFDKLGGAVGVEGIPINCNSGAWNYPMSYQYN